MKTYLLLICITITAPVLFGQPLSPMPPLVSTSGSAQIRVVPDLADLSFEVEVRNADLSIARKQQAERATKILAALRVAGVAEAELQTSQVKISPDYTDRRGETERLQFYRVAQSITCTLHDLKKIPEVTAEAVAAGATGVRDASLRTSQLRKYRDEARVRAIQAAKEKATALTGELGVKLGKPYTITEGTDFRGFSAGNAQVMSVVPDEQGDGTTPTFAPGTISVTASVSVSFLIE